MRRTAILLVMAFVAASCSDGKRAYGDVAQAPAADAAAEPHLATLMPLGGAPAGGSSESDKGPLSTPMLAYAYSYGIALPAAKVDELRRRHEAACRKAGFQVCQVVSTSVYEVGGDQIAGNLVLRATPSWLQRLRDGLREEADAAGGRLLSSEIVSEDLSREIVDTTARLKAKIVLRDRLQSLLADRPGKLADLLAVESELARVQGEIDSTQSQLAVMRARVAMSEITIEYQTMGILAQTGPWSSLARSVNDFVEIVAQSLAAMVRLVAWVAPWALIGSGLLWLFRRRLPKLRWPFRRKTTAPPT